jgi:hypothetical protein
MNPARSPWKCYGSHNPGQMGITTYGESVQPLQSVKLVYQPCSRSRVALDPYGIEDHKWLIIYAIHYSCLLDHVFMGL